MRFPSVTLVSLAILAATGVSSGALADTKNIVLVHGLSVDGSSWRPIYDILSGQGYNVSIVQAPLNGFDNDLHATRLVLDRQDGPVVLVGHSYGGVVITAAGNDPKVEALVYVAAFQPAPGESTGSLNAKTPPLLDPAFIVASEDGHITISEEGFQTDIAPELPSEDARFLFASQAPTPSSVFAVKAGDDPAWLHKPSHAIVARNDRVINPDLQRTMYARAGSIVTEVDAGHMLYLSHPQAVVDVIVEAARSAGN
ncbi:alpha/beta hydrolase (plasmid) [Rhizobium sp. WL3]|uniref:alpha/beta fold hydrolase n=1 Tax=Rhizobium sp. WL3 TaxID=2603277 RepID=UPI0011C20539|nr:alpha/beta hydrolase [Rhizobium sp. WL3]QEE43203.1 alpha/beta hydrolase [Rhizobium sp. WL3]